MKFLMPLLMWSALCFATETRSIGHADLNRFVDEQLDFSLALRNISAAKARMRCAMPAGNCWQITADISTKFWADLVFPVHNIYQTVIDRPSGLVLELSKKIKQKNLSQELRIVYDHAQLRASCSLDSSWAIAENLQSLFALLYQVRGMDLSVADSVYCILDIESQLWSVAGKVGSGEKVSGPFSELTVRELALDFSSPQKPGARSWKTDLLTNRIARHGRLLIRLGPLPESLPLWIQIGSGKQLVTMKLLARKKV